MVGFKGLTFCSCFLCTKLGCILQQSLMAFGLNFFFMPPFFGLVLLAFVDDSILQVIILINLYFVI